MEKAVVDMEGFAGKGNFVVATARAFVVVEWIVTWGLGMLAKLGPPFVRVHHCQRNLRVG